MPRRLLSPLWFSSLALICVGLALPARGDAPSDEQPLIKLLRSDAAPADKALACKQLAVCGSAEAVPALADLLTDPQLASWSRIALEAIPDPAAGVALRDSLDKLQGKLLVGAINSIGVRQESGAVDKLTQLLLDDDAAVASASAVALGRAATPTAVAALVRALDSAPSHVRNAVAQGCIDSAEQQLEEGNAESALTIYDQVRRAKVPKTRELEAIRGAILAGQAAGIHLLVEQLRSNDQAAFEMGLSIARELNVAGTAQALIDQVKKSSPARQGALLSALGDRGDASALPHVIALFDASDQAVRLAAVRATTHLGDASCVAPLLALAAREGGDVAAAALTALERMSGERVDVAVSAQLAHKDRQVRRLALELVGLRRIEALPALLEAAEDGDASIRTAALQALGQTIGPDRLNVLIGKTVAPAHAEDASPAADALRTAAVRMPDRDACADELIEALREAPPQSRCALLEALGMVGGKHAAEALGEAAQDAAREADLRVQDVASRVLGQWMTADAAPPLLDIARGESEEKFRVRALRGYLRIARQFRLSDAERAAMCKEAIKAAQRAEEKQLALEILERYPSLETLQAALDAISEPDLKEPASAIALAMVPKLQAHQAKVSELLEQAGL